jgi:hypothetical protein
MTHARRIKQLANAQLNAWREAELTTADLYNDAARMMSDTGLTRAERTSLIKAVSKITALRLWEGELPVKQKVIHGIMWTWQARRRRRLIDEPIVQATVHAMSLILAAGVHFATLDSLSQATPEAHCSLCTQGPHRHGCQRDRCRGPLPWEVNFLDGLGHSETHRRDWYGVSGLEHRLRRDPTPKRS